METDNSKTLENVKMLSTSTQDSLPSINLTTFPPASKLKTLLLTCYRVLKPGGIVELTPNAENNAAKIESALRMAGFVDVKRLEGDKGVVGKKVDCGFACETIVKQEEVKASVSMSEKELTLAINSALKIEKTPAAKLAAATGTCANCTCGRAKYFLLLKCLGKL